ncbi:MAG: hypothetical protein EOL88_07665 [Bacteroidia bacterium]|nr:hypothetical protein [Bacteroidia bacterium]
MITDTELRLQGVNLLSDKLGLVEAERFLALIQREPFDYTQWQKNLYDGLSVQELSRRAMDRWNQKAKDKN